MAAERYSVPNIRRTTTSFESVSRTVVLYFATSCTVLYKRDYSKTHLLPCTFVKTFLSPFCHFLIFLIVPSFQDSMRLFDVRSNFLLKAFSYPPIKKIFPVRMDGQVDSVLLQIFTRPLWIVTLFCFITRPTFPCIIDPLFWRLSIRITLNLITEK